MACVPFAFCTSPRLGNLLCGRVCLRRQLFEYPARAERSVEISQRGRGLVMPAWLKCGPAWHRTGQLRIDGYRRGQATSTATGLSQPQFETTLFEVSSDAPAAD